MPDTPTTSVTQTRSEITTPHPAGHRRVRPGAAVALALLVVASGVASCGSGDGDGPRSEGDAETETSGAARPVIDPGDGGDYHPDVDPAEFGGPIDNPYLPYPPGARWVYEGISDGEHERVEVVVTDDTRRVMGIDTTVVRDTVTVGGEMVEDTADWFAQDAAGNVWYFGEDSREYENGELVGREGSWEAGVDGALPGIVMPAAPAVGRAYRQEYFVGEAEDLAEVVSLDARVTVVGRAFEGVLVTEEWNPLEPGTVEEKSYAPGVGMVLEEVTAGGEGRLELAEHTTAG